MKTKQNKNNQITNEENAYDKLVYGNYEKAKSSDKFINKQSLENQFLLVENISFESEGYQKLLTLFNNALSEGNEIEFDFGILSFDRDARFSLDKLVPTIHQKPNDHLVTYSLINSDNTVLKQYNDFVVKLLNLQYYVEIFKGLIIWKDENNLIKVFFAKEWTNAN
ncbi:MSC_0623 family F1-like ATPase-associated protein [Metamycoplasma neophronis]|uniref:DUF2714 domain-containing protein n=1 Tax=Metamycoplasma neophronis TaxID=872983 RepID=A0ABY2Z097_9BACT|nr:DUF2714 domain-containing protein [Metamycoplasma neophronis]TPR54064.1 DUF2714 domain-containing protein [Metamycoplasma neophronis]